MQNKVTAGIEPISLSCSKLAINITFLYAPSEHIRYTQLSTFLTVMTLYQIYYDIACIMLHSKLAIPSNIHIVIYPPHVEIVVFGPKVVIIFGWPYHRRHTKIVYTNDLVIIIISLHGKWSSKSALHVWFYCLILHDHYKPIIVLSSDYTHTPVPKVLSCCVAAKLNDIS